MKKSIVFISIIFLLLLGTTVVLASNEGFEVKATVENNRIYVGDKTKVGFTAVIYDPENPFANITLDSYNFTNNGFFNFHPDCFTVKYSSDNSKVATVDDKGVVTGVSTGSATIAQEITFDLMAPNPGPLVELNYGKPNNSCKQIGYYANFKQMGTYTREVKIAIVPDDRLYLCQPEKEPTPVKITMNAASVEIDRLSVGGAMNIDFSVIMTEQSDPTIKYTFNKTDYYFGKALDPENFAVSYYSDNERVATVNGWGEVKGVSEGWTNITVNLTIRPESLDQEGFKGKIRKARLAVKSRETARPVTFTRQVGVKVYSSPVMNNVILAQSETRQLTAGTQTGTWAVNDTSIARIDDTGIITGIRPGKTYAAYYLAKNIENEYGFVMLQIPVVGSVTVYPVMAIHPESITVYIGKPKTINVTFDSWYSGEKAGTWSIADKTVASVDQSGNVTGLKAGTTTATFTITETGAQTDCTVVVKEPPFRIEPDPLEIYNGDTGRLSVTFDSTYTGKKTGTWSVADGTIASVEDNSTASIRINRRHTIPGTAGAKVTGLKPGTTMVTFTNTATGTRRDCAVTVKPAFTIAPNPLTVYAGETGGLAVTFDNGYKGSTDGRWSVDDNTVISVDQNGVVTGKKAGTATAVYTVDPTPAASAVRNGIAADNEATAAVVESASPAHNIVRTVPVVVKPGSFTVTFDPNGGSPVPPSVTVKHGTAVARPGDPSRFGMKFLGWYTASNGGSKWDFTNDKVTADMTLFANWGLDKWPFSNSPNQAPTITGPDTINLLEGYDEVHQPYTFGGSPRPICAIGPISPFSTVRVSLLGFPLDPIKELRIMPGLTVGSYSVKLIASNPLGVVFKTITVNVSPAETLPVITGPDTINLLEGYDSINQTYAFGGNPSPTYGISPTDPNTAGATFSGNTLTIPEGLTEAGSSYSVTLFATNSVGTVTKTVTVNVGPEGTVPVITGPDTINLLEGYDNINQEYTFDGDPAPTYGISLTEPNTASTTFAGITLTIPEGLTEAGSPYSVTLFATNSAGTTTKTVTVNIYPSITINFATEIEFILSSVDNRIDAFGGAGGPYTFTLTPGSSMPDGLVLNSDGTITGTAVTGVYDPVSVVISDCVGNSITTVMLVVRVSD